MKSGNDNENIPLGKVVIKIENYYEFSSQNYLYLLYINFLHHYHLLSYYRVYQHHNHHHHQHCVMIFSINYLYFYLLVTSSIQSLLYKHLEKYFIFSI